MPDIFILWMVGSSLVLLAVAILFLRNQVRPIERLARAAESFGKGRAVPDFKPYGATEVRRAAQAFITMRERIERHVHQRTEMLAGVSHDLKTPLTRMKLELAMMGETPTSRRCAATSPRWSTCWTNISISPAAKAARRRGRPIWRDSGARRGRGRRKARARGPDRLSAGDATRALSLIGQAPGPQALRHQPDRQRAEARQACRASR